MVLDSTSKPSLFFDVFTDLTMAKQFLLEGLCMTVNPRNIKPFTEISK